MAIDSSNPFINRDDLLNLIRNEFIARDAEYVNRRKKLMVALQQPADEISARQRAGKPAICATQIFLEIKWLANYAEDWARADQLLIKLKKVLAEADHPGLGQDDEGSWGSCTTEPYRKLEPTVDELQGAVADKPLKPLRFMQGLLDARATLDRLYRLQISDIRATGVNHRDELGATQTALSQLIFKDRLRDLFNDRPELKFDITTELEVSYQDYLQQTQHPRTGYWGPWYRIGGRLLTVQDLSFTYHTIHYRAGRVDHWPLIIDSTLEIEKLIYPAGWAPKDLSGPFNDHNNYDVTMIFAYGWPHMFKSQKVRVRERLQAMLAWCLTKSIEDGKGFRLNGSSPADAYYFGVRFLDRVGLWDPAKRFWLHRAPALPAGTPPPHQLCVNLLKTFDALNDKSAASATVRSILQTAICTSAAAA